MSWRIFAAAPRSNRSDIRCHSHHGSSHRARGRRPIATIKVQKGDIVRAGELVAELTADELTAAAAQAQAALNAVTANRNNVYAGVRAEQIAALAAEIAKANSRKRPLGNLAKEPKKLNHVSSCPLAISVLGGI
jgi:hypothetical protein